MIWIYICSYILLGLLYFLYIRNDILESIEEDGISKIYNKYFILTVVGLVVTIFWPRGIIIEIETLCRNRS